MSLKPICVKCRRFYRCIKNGFYFIEGMPTENGAPPGTEAPDKWEPYKLWSGDKWRCQGCGHELISGVGRNPIREDHQPDFDAVMLRLGAVYQVNDC